MAIEKDTPHPPASARPTDQQRSSAPRSGHDDPHTSTEPDRVADSNEPRTRTYLEIRPSTTSPDSSAVAQSMRQLFDRLDDRSSTGFFGTRDEQPLVEWLLVADGRPDTSVRYLVGTTTDEFLDELEAIVRTCVPNTYELRRVQWHPRSIDPRHSISEPQTGTAADRERTEPYVAGVEYRGRAQLRWDWQTSLTSFDDLDRRARYPDPTLERADSHRVPLATLVEVLSGTPVPIVYQVICGTYGDSRADRELYRADLERGIVTTGERVVDSFFSRDDDPDFEDLPAVYRERLDDLASRDLRRTFRLSARAIVLARDDPAMAKRLARRLSGIFGHLGGEYHEIVGRVVTDDDLHADLIPPGATLFEAVVDRTLRDPSYDRLGNRLPWKPHESEGIVVTPDELPGFWLIDGTGLTPNGQRALGARQSERTALTLPPPDELDRYAGAGQALGVPLTDDRTPVDEAFVLPPSLQNRHLLVVGDTGSGKSVLTIGAILSNAEATDGPEILLDYKGGGTGEEYLRAHYATYGDLDRVRYFDLTQILPALSIFDIRPLLDAGLSREEARSRIAGHYEEILAGLIGSEQYYGATESTKAIRNHLRALYDPIHGSDAVSHRDLYRALQRTLSDGTPPPTSDDRLSAYFAGLLERDRDVFNKVLGGAVARVEVIATDDRLAPLFDHVVRRAEDDTDEEAPAFDFVDVIDSDRVVIFDFGGMEETVKRALTLVLLSNLWTALKARAEAQSAASTHPLVNLYLEEAKDVAATRLVDTLLAQGRSFELSLMLGVQFPAQLSSADPSNNTYQEALNEIGTFVVGNVSVDDDLAKALATDDSPPRAVERRLAAMRHGEWLVRPAAAFGSSAPRPFLAKSLPAPIGHPASDTPLSGDAQRSFETAFELAVLESWHEAGIAIDETTRAERNESEDDSDDAEDRLGRVDSLLPYTRRLPECVRYEAEMHALRCRSCENRYDPSIDGMRRAIACCHSLDDVDRDDIPVCDVRLKLTRAEREESEWSDRQLLFVQAVYNAQQGRYDPLEYDLLSDSMLRLQEYVGIEPDEIQGLIDADLLRHDTDHPHRLYSVSPEGRSIVGESYRQGVDYGHGAGDLEESSQHVFGIEVGKQYLERAYRQNPDSAVESVVPYYDLDDQHRLDIAGLDDEGAIVVTVEVERVNNDVHRAVLDDFDKMAACDPEEAIWIVMKQSDGHTIVSALNDPIEGDPRVEKTYAKTTPPQQFRITTPGLTAVYPAEWLRDRVANDEVPL